MKYIADLDHLQQLIHACNILIVKLGAVWCAPCVKVDKSWRQMANSTKYASVKFATVDLTKRSSEVMRIYNYCGACKIPYFVVYSKGKRTAGIQTSDSSTIQKMLDATLSS
jgi:thioredoxin-like negative regulator of GroEL